MVSCLVPDFPAVMVALEHLKELDRQLKEDRIPFAPEASLHLTEITAAVTELEADRRAAHERLEVETIENSKLREKMKNIRERMSQEITADVAAARASNAEEMEQLHKDLHHVSQLRDAAVRRQEALSGQNEALHPEREQAKAEHEAGVAALDDQITVKYDLQVQLDQTRAQIEELRSCIAAVERDEVMLQQNVALEREAFAVRKDNLSWEVDQVELKIKQQKQEIRRSRRELDGVNDMKREANDRLGELTIQTALLESGIRRAAVSRCQCEKQLEAERRKCQELRQQRETLKKELRELGEAFRVAVQRLKEDVATVEGKIEEGRASRLLRQDALAQSCEMFKRQHDDEREVKAEHLHVSQQLERSKLQLEERVASIVKHSKQIKEMDKQIRELLEADAINKRVFERSQEEMCGNVDTEKKNISHLEEETSRLRRLLEEAKRKQEEHVAKMSSKICDTGRRHQELLQEEAALLQRQPKSADADEMTSHVTRCQVEYRRKEAERCQEIERCATEIESVTRSGEEKQREAEEVEEMLKEVEPKWSEEQSRHQRLKALTSELRKRRSDLEKSIQETKERTGALLEPREEMKAELEELRGRHIDPLAKQASELRAVETSIYDSSVKLEKVGVENSRLRLCIRQMTDGVGRAREDKDRYRQEIQRLKRDAEALFESLQEAWREDLSVTQGHQSRDRVLLVSTGVLLDHLKTRRQQMGNVSTLLHRQMLDFSKRLGYKTTGDQQSLTSVTKS